MRRSTPGVARGPDAIAARLARIEAMDPERIVTTLEPLVTEARRERLRAVIRDRLACVAVVFDRPYDPHNGAAVMRSCEAFGAQRLLVVEREGTPFALARAVARSAEKWIDVTVHKHAQEVVAWARAESMALVSARPDGELEPEALAGLPRVAIVIGNEREGVQEELERACAHRVRVPMRGFVDSLNVSVTAAILLHAATRGRTGDLDDPARRRLYARGLYLSVPHADDILTP